VIPDVEGVEDLPRSRCLELLSSRSLGRIALSQRALPTVVPVTYRLVGDRLVFVSPRESGILTRVQHPVVAFEVDDIDPGTLAGWSVVVVGVVEGIEVDNPSWSGLISDGGQLQAGAGDLLAGLITDHISGRRFSPFDFRGRPSPEPDLRGR
jgi:uncharacterized protein